MSKANSKSRRTTVDDDLDDLDDLITDFKTTRPSAGPSQAPAPPNTAVPPNTATGPTMNMNDLDIGNDFARELAEGMAALMRDIAAETVKEEREGAESTLTSEEEQRREAEFKKAWEQMLVNGMNGMSGMKDPHDGSQSEEGAADDRFQSAIQDTMKKLKIAEDAEAEPKLPEDENEMFEKLISQLSEGGAESDDDLNGILENMMSQLMSKDVLYEPLKELHTKFPAYLKDNAATMKAEDKQRFESQQKIVTQIVEIFEDPSYSPENADQGIKIVNLMNTMQNFGSPPPEIMGPLPPGLDLGPDGLPQLPDGCCIQ